MALLVQSIIQHNDF
jgi:hypothetical protein